MMEPKFNVGDKVIFNRFTGDTLETEIICVKQYYTINHFGGEIDVPEGKLEKHRTDISDATVTDILEELKSRGFTSIELKKDFDLRGYE